MTENPVPAEKKPVVAHNAIDLTGQVFGRLVAIKRSGSKHRAALWECLCACGNTIIIACGSLRSGSTKSCGCLRKEITGDSHRTHGMTKTSTYSTWCAMINRCNNKNASDYEYYGGRGITICSKWLKFENFLNDMGKRPNGLSVDRIDNNLGYFKENCRWVSRTIQSRNQRVNRTNKTGVTGVEWHELSRKYRAIITVKRKHIHLGMFDTIEMAAEARKQGEIKYWGREYA